MNKRIALILILLVGSIQMADTQKTLKEIYRSGTVRLTEVMSIGYDSVPEDTPLKRIADFAIAPNGDIFVSDPDLNNIKVFHSDGTFKKIIGQKGTGPGDLNYPYKLATNKKYLYVYEMMNRRISIFRHDGTFVKFHQMKGFNFIEKLICLPSGDVVFQQKFNNFGQNIGQEQAVFLFSSELELKKELFRKKVLTDTFISKPRANIPQPYNPLISWDTSKDGHIVFGFQDKYLIGIYKPDGEKISEFTHTCQKVKVTREEKDAVLKNMVFSSSDGSESKKIPTYVSDNMKFPDFKPVFHQINTDHTGHILVFTQQATKAEAYSIDVFSPAGKFINTVKINKKLLSPDTLKFHAGHLMAIAMNEDEEPELKKYRIE